MKYFVFVLALFPFFAFQCQKGNNKCLQGKIIRVSCASYVIQVVSTDTIGDDQWKDSREGQQNSYDNVFNASNKCKIPSNFKEGDTIYFELERPEPNDCIVCMMYDAPPATRYQVANVSAEPCAR
jgi:hypothetical protein